MQISSILLHLAFFFSFDILFLYVTVLKFICILFVRTRFGFRMIIRSCKFRSRLKTKENITEFKPPQRGTFHFTMLTQPLITASALTTPLLICVKQLIHNTTCIKIGWVIFSLSDVIQFLELYFLNLPLIRLFLLEIGFKC